MHESDDHLAALLKLAADAAGGRTVPAPPAEILARGTRRRRRRFAAIAGAACLAVGAVTGIAVSAMPPSDRGGRVEPARDPSPNLPPAVPSESITVEPGPGKSTTFAPPGSGNFTTIPPNTDGSATSQSLGSDGPTTTTPGPGESTTMSAASSD